MKFAAKNHRLKAALIVLSVLLFGAVTATVAAFLPLSKAEFDRSGYRAELVAIYKEYNTKSAYKNYENGDEFAFARLLVNGYNGKKYGAVRTAFDEPNGFAVLQYKTPAEAKKAYYKFQSDGLLVDVEGTAKLCETDKGTLYPEGSAALGTPQYIGKYNMGSDDVTVALIDTGVMYDHEAIANRFVSHGYDFSDDGCPDAYFDTEKAGDVYGHATFIAGILADNTPDTVKILPYKVVPFGINTATSSSMVSAINDAVANGAEVINISITTSSGANSFRAAIQNAKSSGVCVCAAAGNQSKEIKYLYPAAIDETITVTALENDFETFAEFSNHGAAVDFCATGRKIVSLAPYTTSGDSRTRKNSGTSFSSPYIAALCADLKTIDSAMPVDDLCGVLKDFSTDFGEQGWDAYYGWGMPSLADITYTDSESYILRIPEGTLNIYGTKDYTADSLPWRIFAGNLADVTVDSNVERIGDYNFYNVKANNFTVPQNLDKIGKYAFYGCKNVKEYTFTENCQEVGEGAFCGIENFVVNGYRNTPAETYALSEDVTFNALGCRHHYLIDIFDPTETEEGYTVYTCTVCGDSYRGGYIVPAVIDEGACGDNLTYKLDDTGRLTISGAGDMYDYSKSPSPWAEFADSVSVLQIGSQVGEISPFAFYSCGIVKIRCADSNALYTVDDNVLYSKNKAVLALLPQISGTVYTMPDDVTDFSASAFLVSGTAAVKFNSNFTVQNGVVYAKNGDIVCALQSFGGYSFEIADDISIRDFAFILTPYPQTYSVGTRGVDFGECSAGYYFDGTMQKRDVLFETYDVSTAADYANDNGFALRTYNKGECGDSLNWHFDTDSKTLTISGEGEMYSYAASSEIPWSEYTSSIKEAVIGDGVTALSDYAFYGAASLNKLTLPLSLGAPQNGTIWYNCSAVKTIKFTHGTGYTDDYADSGVTYYQNTPWYISRKSITTFDFDETALGIGREAFRGCYALKELTLNNCEKIDTDAFLSCTRLNTITITAKDTEIADYALAGYKVSSYGIYGSVNINCFDDSTARDYCDKFGVLRTSLGCGHSRYTTLISKEEHDCCFDSVYTYRCDDCDSDFDEYVHTTDGHYVTGSLKTLTGTPVDGAEVYIDGAMSAVTYGDGRFVAEDIRCGTHTVEFKNDSDLFCTATLTVDKHNTCGDLAIAYGDYNGDGFVNGRDLAFAKLNGIADYKRFDFGAQISKRYVIDTPYGEQILPHGEGYRFADDTDSDYRKVFSATIVNPGAYKITSSGFLYGVRMTADDLTLENANTYNASGSLVRIAESVVSGAVNKELHYGIKSKSSWFGVRFYITYTNGAQTHTYYSDVYRYNY
ncbi:MAG: leucine-rich repeat protein [Eubacterium sp.]|nr:leucine-rich repeat protein [Eubacterium sp.]